MALIQTIELNLGVLTPWHDRHMCYFRNHKFMIYEWGRSVLMNRAMVVVQLPHFELQI